MTITVKHFNNYRSSYPNIGDSVIIKSLQNGMGSVNGADIYGADECLIAHLPKKYLERANRMLLKSLQTYAILIGNITEISCLGNGTIKVKWESEHIPRHIRGTISGSQLAFSF